MKRRELTEKKMHVLLDIYKGVIYSALKKLEIYRSHQDFEDYFQEGCLQLFTAYELCQSDPLLDSNRYTFIHFLQKRLNWAFLDCLRKDQRLREQETTADSTIILVEDCAACLTDIVETDALLQGLLALLSDQERDYLQDRVFHELSMTEIAQKQGVSRKTVHEWRRRIQEKATYFLEQAEK